MINYQVFFLVFLKPTDLHLGIIRGGWLIALPQFQLSSQKIRQTGKISKIL